MKDWHVFSSDDLLNWTDHGAVMSLDDITWADNYAWAPDAAYKNGKYYLVFPAGTGVKDLRHPEKNTKWMGIGIGVSESPTGPFRDAIGSPLWRTPYANDPALFIDDDGKAYLYFHGQVGSIFSDEAFDYRVVEMSDDMRSIRGEFIKMDMNGHEPKMEGPWVFKKNDLYCFTMPENNRELSHYTSSTPIGPWTYRGVFMEAEGLNNHHSIVQYKGEWILFYHRWLATGETHMASAGGDGSLPAGYQRHVCAELIEFDSNGTILPVKRTDHGLAAAAARIARVETP